MAIPAGVQHVVFGGSLPGGERWQTGFWLQGHLPTTEAAANAQAEIMFDTANASDSSGAMRYLLENLLPNNVTFDLGRVYVYTGGGPTADLIGEFVPDAPVTGGHSGPRLPNQCCVVVSLRTGAPGRRNRGRMYLPLIAATLDANGQLSASDCTGLAAAWGTFFADVAASDAGTPVVVSRVAGSARQITQVIVDSRVDIQRRRANQETIETSVSHGAIGP